MKHTIQYHSFKVDSSDKYTIQGHQWKSKHTASHIIILIHGLGGHGLRYAAWAEILCSKGFAVYSLDLRGHGKSDGSRGDAKSIYSFFKDITALLSYISANEDNALPKLMYGNSLGGLLTAMYALKEQNDINGAILTAPWFKLSQPLSRTSKFLIALIAKVIPKYSIKTGVDSSKLRPDNNVERKEQDPYAHKRISARLLYSIHKLTYEYEQNIPLLRIPTLAIHGKKDQVTDANQTHTFMDHQIIKTETLILDNASHEIHLEEERTMILEKLQRWIKERL